MSNTSPDYILAFGVFYQFNEEEIEIIRNTMGYPKNQFPYFFLIEEQNAFIISEPNSVFIVGVCANTEDLKFLKYHAKEYMPLDLNPRNVQNNEGLAEYILEEFGHCSSVHKKSNRLWRQLKWHIDDSPDFIIFQKYGLYNEYTSNRSKNLLCSIL